jgi:4-alpha-glucanotransferase
MISHLFYDRRILQEEQISWLDDFALFMALKEIWRCTWTTGQPLPP